MSSTHGVSSVSLPSMFDVAAVGHSDELNNNDFRFFIR